MEVSMVSNLVANWKQTLGISPRCEMINPTKLVCRLTSAEGKAYILKDVGENKRTTGELMKKVDTEISVLRHLAAHDVPVALPVPTDQGRPYIFLSGRFYTLTPVLPEKFDETTAHLDRLYRNLGIAMARLHTALADYPGEIHSWQMNLPQRILLQAAQGIEKQLDAKVVMPLDYALANLREPINSLLSDLPTQLIHGDCHGGNVLFNGESVSGFIDLDHLPYGPRIWDLGYFLADWVKNRFRNPTVIEPWFGALPELLKGYDQEARLSGQEKKGILYVMLGVQLIFAEFFFNTLKQPARAQFNLEAFYWIYENQDRIQLHLMSTRSLR